MAQPFATVSDLEGSLGRTLTSAESAKAEAALRYASNLVRASYPAVNLLPVVPDAVLDAVVSLAERRFLAARDGATQRTVGGVSVQYRSADVRTFSEDERVLLNAALGSSGNLTVSLAGPPVVP